MLSFKEILSSAASGLIMLRAASADPRYLERPPLLHFEPNYHDAFAAADEQRRRERQVGDVDRCSSAIEPPVSPLDLRVTKAHADHGYDAVRISVVTSSPDPPPFVRGAINEQQEEEVLEWDYSGPFKYRWTAQFDTGLHDTRCSAGDQEHAGSGSVESSPLLASSTYVWGGYDESPAPDSQCLFACQDDEECKFYSFYWDSETKECQCELFRSCEKCRDLKDLNRTTFIDDVEDLVEEKFHPHTQTFDGWTTTKKYGNSYMHTRITRVLPGVKNPFSIDGNTFDVRIPLGGEQAKCIAWGDPCISSKFVGCSFGEYFDAYEKSVSMINALAESEEGFDCFILLGDNFYDSDGRITTSFWKRMTLKAMSKVLIYVLGNHDIWTGGGPSNGIYYDPLQYSIQYFGLDTVAGLEPAATGRWLNYEINPDSPPPGSGTQYQSITATSSVANTLSWFKFGGYGMLFFNGAYDSNTLTPYFEMACDFFDKNVDEDETILLIGHWNGNATIQSWILPYGGQVVTPDARKLLLDTPGCSRFGKRIIYFDGHGHTNTPVEVDNGYLAGGHGIMGVNPQNFSEPVAADYGFIFTQSNPTKIYYCQEIFSDTLPVAAVNFDPSTINDDNYNAILDCLQMNDGGIGNCVDLCEEWPYFGAPATKDEEEEKAPAQETTLDTEEQLSAPEDTGDDEEASAQETTRGKDEAALSGASTAPSALFAPKAVGPLTAFSLFAALL